MAHKKKKTPEFFDPGPFDPVSLATGHQHEQKTSSVEEKKKTSVSAAKKKAGFYLPAELLERFDRTFYALKLEGDVRIDNKSTLVEAAIKLALDDIDKGDKSVIRKMLMAS